MVNPIPPDSNPPATPPSEDANGPSVEDVQEDIDTEPADDELPPLSAPPRWPAVVRWARLCRVLAFVSLIGFGWGAASNLYYCLTFEPEFVPFMQQRMTAGWYFLYALAWALVAIVSCISLLGFAELLHLLISIEATARDRGNRVPPSEPIDMDLDD